MATFTFDPPTGDEDVLDVQGVQYPMNPVGMRAMRKLLTMQKAVADRKETDPLTEADLDMALEIVVGAVRPEVRDKFRDHIEDSVSPNLLIQIATAVMGEFSGDGVDPTQPELSSGGSSTTGPDSTAGALAAVSTPVL